jgi:hypothetical protein
MLYIMASDMATLEPELTHNTADQHLSGHTSPDMWLLLICVAKLLPTKGVLFLCLLVVGDVNVTQFTHVVIIVRTNFC